VGDFVAETPNPCALCGADLNANPGHGHNAAEIEKAFPPDGKLGRALRSAREEIEEEGVTEQACAERKVGFEGDPECPDSKWTAIVDESGQVTGGVTDAPRVLCAGCFVRMAVEILGA
jgi:hypothetical protein